jgi:hypothetical protein
LITGVHNGGKTSYQVIAGLVRIFAHYGQSFGDIDRAPSYHDKNRKFQCKPLHSIAAFVAQSAL